MEREVQDRQWYIVTRWLQYSAELRVNNVRMVAILILYAVQCANYYGVNALGIQWPRLEGLSAQEHSTITWAVVLWLAMSSGLFLCLKLRRFPGWLIYVSVGLDAVLLSIVLMVRGGAASPLVIVYFVILAMAAARFSLPLVRYAAVLVSCCYLFVLGATKWFGFGDRVERHEQVITLIGLVLTGVVLGQVVRLTRLAGREYSVRLMERMPGSALVGSDEKAESEEAE